MIPTTPAAPRGLIAFDLDGTVYAERSDARIRPRVARAFAAAHEQGYALAVATGRRGVDLADELLTAPWLGWSIGSSGATIHRVGERQPLRAHLIPADAVAEVRRLLGDLPEHWWVQTPAGFFCEGAAMNPDGTPRIPLTAYLVNDILRIDDVERGFYKVVIHVTTERERLQAEELLAPVADVFEIANEGPISLELTAKGVSKGAAALELCSLVGIDPATSIAFGDSGNDLSFAATPLTFVVMASAEQKVLDAGDDICPDVRHDGVAAWLEEHVLRAS